MPGPTLTPEQFSASLAGAQPAVLTAVRAELSRAATDAVQLARAAAPRNSGELVGSIRATVIDTSAVLTAGSEHASFVDARTGFATNAARAACAGLERRLGPAVAAVLEPR